ncbi:MAG: TSUP family transporter [Candidatus Altiarchaeales archaeon]|nr:TSUP family transporter [Candidatus Altiarchaeales archaeon]MBD3416443.1 TSUP family transporter [Candidatus Altiarchaeales archaeon]
MDFIVLSVSGFLIGALGTIIGSGGGFLVVPLLLLLTDLSPQVIAGTSLTVALFTSLSGFVAYHRQRKIDYLVAGVFVLALIPATFIGVEVNQRIEADQFRMILGVLLVMISTLLFKRVNIRIPHYIPYPIHYDREKTDSQGVTYKYHVSMRRGALMSFVIGVVSPVVGIGGGVLRTPAMVVLEGMPARIAAPTSQVTTIFGGAIAVALFAMKSQINISYAIPLIVGVIVGAQVGALFSERYGLMVRKITSAALFITGLWLLL